jgi:phytoene dehydrogenase-like protein
MSGFDSVVIGAGVNSLVAAATLARAGDRVLVLEAGEIIGAEAARAEFAPGFHAAPLALDAGWLPPPVASELGITGLVRVVPGTPVSVPCGEGEWLALSAGSAAAAEAIRRYSASDAGGWPAFAARIGRLASLLEALYVLPPPDIESSALPDLLPLLGVARKLRGMGRAAMIELLRVLPMSVQEYLDDELECVPLKAAIGATGILEIRQGPRSGGTAFALLHRQVGIPGGAIRGGGYWKAGPDALVRAVAAIAERRGVVVRTGAEAVRIEAADDRTTGVTLANGETIAAPTVLSGADPAHTLLRLVDPVWLDPEFLLAVRNIKFRGGSARVLFALEALPEFPGLPNPADALLGTLTLSRSLDEIERAADAAKYGRISERPHVEVQIPSLRWPDLAPSGKHVLVASAQWAPYRLADGGWTRERRDALGDAVASAIGQVAPGFQNLIRERVVGSPAELEATFGFTEGSVTQGEMSLDQILFMRPVPGSSRYETPLRGLYLCGAGTHPGGGIPGGPGWLAARQVLRNRRQRGKES